MTDTFRVVSITPYPDPRPAGAHFALAQLHVEIGPLLITGCTLARTSRGTLRVWLPSGNRNERIILRDQADYDRLTQAAVKEYRAVTGNDPADPPLAKALSETDRFNGPAYDPA